MPNSFDADLCTKCGKPLSIEVAIAVEEKEENEKNEILQKLVSIEEDLAKVKKRQERVENARKKV